MVGELTVLGCSGSFGAPPAGACSGYLVRHGSTAIWMDCGNGTFAHLQEHLAVEEARKRSMGEPQRLVAAIHSLRAQHES